jgi:8-oxo-dGTP pyrophosphatase MutT (NUDIX family)
MAVQIIPKTPGGSSSLDQIVPIVTKYERVSIGGLVLSASLGEDRILLVKAPYSHHMNNFCYLVATSSLGDQSVADKLKGIVSRISVEEYTLLSDPDKFGLMVGNIYSGRMKHVPNVMAGYRKFSSLLRSFKHSGRSFESGWSLPKGGPEGQEETREKVLKREMLEETGLSADHFKILPIEPFQFVSKAENFSLPVWIYFLELDGSHTFSPSDKAKHEIEKAEFVSLAKAKALLPTEVWTSIGKALPRYFDYRSKRMLSLF